MGTNEAQFCLLVTGEKLVGLQQMEKGCAQGLQNARKGDHRQNSLVAHHELMELSSYLSGQLGLAALGH